MDLREKLRGLGAIPAAPVPVPLTRRHGIEGVVEGFWQETPAGQCFVARTTFPLDHQHGHRALGDLLAYSPRRFADIGRSERLEDFRPASAVFLDTETTGLAGGTGTYVFLVGLGYVEAGAFTIDQYFLTDIASERALLRALGGALSRFQGVVTFNGKAFDLPLLETRFTVTRVPGAMVDPPHLDLLAAARRIWRHRLESCSLGSLEQHVLGHQRWGDVPGWMIPGMYFDYLRGGDARPLAAVFAHNRTDILSLLTLASTLCELYEHPFDGNAGHPAEYFGLARAFGALGRWDAAARAYTRALEARLPEPLRVAALRELSLLHKRVRQAAEAVEIWETLVFVERSQLAFPYVELAKHHEHARRDHETAAKIVRLALERLVEARNAGQLQRDLQHRLDRLERKLGERR